MSGTFGGGLKSVQRGTLTMASNPQTVTITAVDVNKSILLVTYSGGDTSPARAPRAVLTNTTTITLDQTTTDTATRVDWQVEEEF